MNCDCVFCKNKKQFDIPLGILDSLKNGELVLFCGAGISTENKNVVPISLYEEISEELQIEDNNLSFSKLMQKYCDLPNGRRELLKRIKRRFEYINSFQELKKIATMFHNELSELYLIDTIITTNWDTYFEEYCGATPIVTPEDCVFWGESDRCVLKIHGSISSVGSIVATEKDYEACASRLEKGIIGSILKNILATKTVVFVGYSFGDEDLLKIIEYLKLELKDVMPHIYIVTLDEKLESQLEYDNITFILTDGTHFLHELKKEMINSNLIENYDILPKIEYLKNIIEEIHRDVSSIDISEYPSLIYCLFYQDGMIHTLEKFIQLHNTGYYNRPGIILELIKLYENVKLEYVELESYENVAYCDGIISGLELISNCGKEIDYEKIKFLYLPNSDKTLTSYEIFKNELERVKKIKEKYNEYAKKIINSKKNPNIIHHKPYI